MESLITETRLGDELEAFKATASLLASQKIRYSDRYVPPLEDRSRKPTLVQVPVCEPPTTSSDNDEDASTSIDHVSLTIKSLKPPLSLTLSASPTSAISSLKQQLSKEHSSSPPPEQQRWILKGKAMGDSKLLKEFTVQDGTTINLMINKSAVPAAASSGPADPVESPLASTSSPSTSTSPSVPSLTLSEPTMPSTSSSSTSPPSVSIEKDLDRLPLSTSTSGSVEAHSSEHYRSHISDPSLWIDVRDVLEKRFESKEGEAQQAWEGMLSGCQEWITPNQKALIREQVGYSAMGGY